ncbi:MAG: hypothetical protein RL653_1764 [Pseudomonadota bacterium]|jgi:hypothetical protein
MTTNKTWWAAWLVCCVVTGCGAGQERAPGADGGAEVEQPADGGSPGLDAGATTPGPDAGATEPDAGLAPVDAGTVGGADAGSGLAAAPFAAGSDACGAAPVLGAGRWRVDTAGAAGDFTDMAGPCGTGASLAGPDLFFALDVPAGHLVRVKLEAGAFSGARIALVRDCSALATSCERVGNAVVSWANPGGTPETLRLVVDGLLAQHAGEANLEVAFEPLSQQPAGATCTAPLTLSAPGTVTGSTAGRDNLVDGYVGPAGVCNRYGSLPGLGGGGDATWAVEVPAGATVTVTATPQGSWDLVLGVLDGCGPAATHCASWSDPGTAQLSNPGATPRIFFVVVDGFHPYSAGSYTLQASAP